MLEQIKNDLRISHDKLDGDIQENVKACLLDLKRVGVPNVKTKDNNSLILKAVKLYCRWQYNFENQADRYMRHYEKLRNALSLSEVEDV